MMSNIIFPETIYDMYRLLGFTEKEIDRVLSSIFDDNSIDFSN